jgi:predicted small lipoprotein YifL
MKPHPAHAPAHASTLASALALALLVAGCGHKGALTRVPADSTLSAEERRIQRAREEEETTAGLRLPPEARPIRQDDVLSSTEELRRNDAFTLPPP